MKNIQTTLLIAAILVASVLGGMQFDQWRAKQKAAAESARLAAQEPPKNPPPLPQRGTLITAGDDVEVSGTAICAYCNWREGGSSCNTVLQMSSDPGIVFVLPNEQRTAMDKLTGTCAAGDYRITARGTITQYNGHNYLLVKNFDAVNTK